MEIAEEADQWQTEADRMLERSDLLTLLREYGDVYITGSYRYGLMMSGDIDLYLLAPQADKQLASSLLSTLVTQGFWTGYLFYDWVQFRHADFPVGYYIGLKAYPADVRWKVDIWILPELTRAQRDYNQKIESLLTPESRNLILSIKKERDQNNGNMPSTSIYTAVLEGNINTLEEYHQSHTK